jgi:pyruvate/2-oxoglutarate dehydrogenase complex dihydrolipoamide dehydrogenase (E3) component
MRARRPIPGAELARTFDGLRDLTRLPASVVVIGGADTGCQLASILGDFGAQVTLVEASPRSRSARGRLAPVQTPSSASSRPDRIALTNAS